MVKKKDQIMNLLSPPGIDDEVELKNGHRRRNKQEYSFLLVGIGL
ncbi:hypothetical protein [Cytobacillus sp. NCCP-133]|nr:hypothetical protein [Cytobacillus sp. NCCP-133]GLB60761.1 hypothetical protein NCCP133_28930 [Cytobacillus sp. NCCP-133]